ncbi:MAG: glutamine amidotransferase, partial [Acidimicrobiia bacterium]
MCGIAGRILAHPGRVGADLVLMMEAQVHRGGDSTGFALYGPPRTDGYIVRVVAQDRYRLSADLDLFYSILKGHGADFLEDPAWDGTGQTHVSVRMVITEPASGLSTWLEEADDLPGFEIQSVGRSLEIIKDVGSALEVAAKHREVEEFTGTHGIANARMATESRVSPTASHPFWARPFPDVAIVHNGQLTNYHLLRERLERHGYRFKTENDSELIAVWISDQMARGRNLDEALNLSLRALDGVFTYLITTPNRLGMAKDRWAIKPLAAVDDGPNLAIATEEQAVRKVYPEEVDVTTYDGPDMTKSWDIRIAEAA